MKKNISENFYQAIHRSMPNPIIGFDLAQKKLVFSSGIAEDLLGYSSKELKDLGEDQFISIIHPDDIKIRKNIEEQLKTLKDGGVLRYILRIKKKDGSYVHFQINDSIYERDELGNPTKITSVAQDITELALSNEKLKMAITKIDNIRQKNSHDLRAPVATIIGILDLIKEEEFQNQYQHDLIEYLKITVLKLDAVIREINEESSLK